MCSGSITSERWAADRQLAAEANKKAEEDEMKRLKLKKLKLLESSTSWASCSTMLEISSWQLVTKAEEANVEKVEIEEVEPLEVKPI